MAEIKVLYMLCFALDWCVSFKEFLLYAFFLLFIWRILTSNIFKFFFIQSAHTFVSGWSQLNILFN